MGLYAPMQYSEGKKSAHCPWMKKEGLPRYLKEHAISTNGRKFRYGSADEKVENNIHTVSIIK